MKNDVEFLRSLLAEHDPAGGSRGQHAQTHSRQQVHFDAASPGPPQTDFGREGVLRRRWHAVLAPVAAAAAVVAVLAAVVLSTSGTFPRTAPQAEPPARQPDSVRSSATTAYDHVRWQEWGPEGLVETVDRWVSDAGFGRVRVTAASGAVLRDVRIAPPDPAGQPTPRDDASPMATPAPGRGLSYEAPEFLGTVPRGRAQLTGYLTGGGEVRPDVLAERATSLLFNRHLDPEQMGDMAAILRSLASESTPTRTVTPSGDAVLMLALPRAEDTGPAMVLLSPEGDSVRGTREPVDGGAGWKLLQLSEVTKEPR